MNDSFSQLIVVDLKNIPLIQSLYIMPNLGSLMDYDEYWQKWLSVY
jgi:hypothetical protein